MWPLVPLMQNSIQTDSGEQFLHRQIRASAPQKGHHFTGNLNHFHLTAPCTSEVMSGLFTDEKTHVHDHSLVRVSNPVAGLLDKTLVFVNNVLSCINTITHSTQLCLFVSEGRIGSRVSLSMTVKACSVHNTVVSQTFTDSYYWASSSTSPLLPLLPHVNTFKVIALNLRGTSLRTQ